MFHTSFIVVSDLTFLCVVLAIFWRKRRRLLFGGAAVLFVISMFMNSDKGTSQSTPSVQAQAVSANESNFDAKAKADADFKAKADADAKAKADEEAKAKADADAKANENIFKVIGYDIKYNIVMAVANPTHDAVRNATAKILVDKDLHLQKINKDGINLLINYYTDEKAAQLSLKVDTTDEEDSYIENHWYAQYSSGNLNVPPIIMIYGINAKSHAIPLEKIQP